MSGTAARLKKLGITIPTSNPPVANYAPYAQIGNIILVSGQTARENGQMKYAGKVGADYTIEQGQEAARLCALNVLSQINTVCKGDLDRVKKVVKLNVYVNATDDFKDHPLVANAASDLMVQIFGDHGVHGRAAVGCSSLPGGSAVEIEGIFEIDISLHD
jgi:enamine deaminase RidA (YjgF/YER057c/UK114 family)